MDKIGPALDPWRQRFESLPPDPQRSLAYERFTAAGLPHRRMEAWRWTDMRRRPGSKIDGADPGNPVSHCSGPVFAFGERGPVLPDPLPRGVRIAEGGWASDMPEIAGPMADMALALTTHRTRLRIEATPGVPLVFRFEHGGFACLDLDIAPGVELDIVESHLAPAAAEFASTAIRFDIGAGAHVTRGLFQAGDTGVRQASSALFRAASSASFVQTALALGAGQSRLETHGVMTGDDGRCTLNAAYIVGPGRHADLTSLVHFRAPGCKARQTVRGIAADGALGAFQGKFEVDRVAQQTDAAMHHSALLLTDRARINARPELEIYADDVRCAHGNAIGTLDETVIFYMRQRGLDDKEARLLLAAGFAREALEQFPDAALREAFLSEAETWLTTCL